MGYTVHTLAEVYGERRAQELEDEEWIEHAGRENWVVLTKDDRIRYRHAERDAFVAAGLRVFCLTTGKLRAEQQTARFVNNINRIVRQARNPGPYIYAVYEKRVERIWPERTTRSRRLPR